MQKNKGLGIFLVVIYITVVLYKITFLGDFLSPCIGDEISYYFLSKYPFAEKIFNSRYPPLFPLFFYPLHFFVNDIETKYQLIKLINILISSLAIFPAFYLVKIFLNNFEAFLVAILSVLIPTHFVHGSFLMRPEGLFLVLFLTSVFFIFKYEQTENKFYGYAGGIFAGLLILTKILGLFLIPAYLLTILVLRKNINKYFLIGTLVATPYFIYNALKFGFTEYGVTGYSITCPTVSALNGGFGSNILSMFNAHFGALILGSGLIFGILSVAFLFKLLSKDVSDRLTKTLVTFLWLSIIIVCAICGLFLPGEPNIRCRYIFFLLPLIFVVGIKFIHLLSERKISSVKDSLFIGGSFMVMAVCITFFTGVKVGNHWGEISLLYGYFNQIAIISVVGGTIALTIYLLVIKKYQKQIITYGGILLTLCFFIYGNSVTIQKVSGWGSYWYEMKGVGEYISSVDGKIIFDKDLYRDFWGGGVYYNLCFWSDRLIPCRAINSSNSTVYIITRKKMNSIQEYEWCDEIGRCVYVYKKKVNKNEI
ncbi:MAG: hypothetical protein DRP18_00200 [Candidatus Aenigmatarchaeota archaeon]|nr:MAG: hypothetical protein DRP18_00200 [Candidatus Aenigmarchaeota archaeon]